MDTTCCIGAGDPPVDPRVCYGWTASDEDLARWAVAFGLRARDKAQQVRDQLRDQPQKGGRVMEGWDELKCEKCGKFLAEICGRRIRIRTLGADIEGNARADIKCSCGAEAVWFGEGEDNALGQTIASAIASAIASGLHFDAKPAQESEDQQEARPRYVADAYGLPSCRPTVILSPSDENPRGKERK